MNTNQIITRGFSNPESEKRYKRNWEDEPDVQALYFGSRQCGGCSFYAIFNADYGLCCHPKSRHYLETVFEHFACLHQQDESWQSHSFTDFNADPRSLKMLRMRFDIPEDIFDRICEQTDCSDDEIFLAIWNVLLREFGSNRQSKPPESIE